MIRRRDEVTAPVAAPPFPRGGLPEAALVASICPLTPPISETSQRIHCTGLGQLRLQLEGAKGAVG
jgi:hypothetical protein